ncbi:MAG: hypothetical protein HZY75_05275 [Nocardioidaceae bacterium]|nr:MAG: hypothetical protein HZY75_05275 [Nocardioidaceae bacterium]
MTSVQQPNEPEPRVSVHDPEEALRRARPLPAPEDIEIEGLTTEEWDTFYQAISRA